MGILVRDILSANTFKDFKLVAGESGLDNHVQGVIVMDSPDGFKWNRGREWMITSGYVLAKNPGLMEYLLESDELQGIQAVGIKFGRYIDELPPEILAAFDEKKLPLISIPYGANWMEIMNDLNVLVMNQSIRQFNIANINLNDYSNVTYHVRKIYKILSQIENEMNFPTMLYDLSNKKAYYSSDAFLETAHHLDLEDFWTPRANYETEEVLCDNLNMIRYRLRDDKYNKPYSWITVPINADNKTVAYFVVTEATGLIDYFDQFSLRIGFVILQSLFEQMLMAQNIGDAGFEKFILECLADTPLSEERFHKHVIELDLNPQADYYLALMTQNNADDALINHHQLLKNAFNEQMRGTGSRKAFIDDNHCLFLIPKDYDLTDTQNVDRIQNDLLKLHHTLSTKLDTDDIQTGLVDQSDTLYNIKRNVDRSHKILANSRILFPDQHFSLYSELGVFAWMDIQEDEMVLMQKDFSELLADEENSELIETLKVYLDCKMNYSQTAKKLYVHTNTVRNRMEQINDLISLDLENPIERLKLEVLLKVVTQPS